MRRAFKVIISILFITSFSSCNIVSQDRIEKIYYDDGKLKRINFYQNDTIGRCKFFRKDGSIESDITIEKNIKFFKMYSKDGSLSGEFKTVNGQKQGEGKVYDKSGSLIVIWNYVNDLKHGEQIFYSKDGKIERREYYEYGKLINEKEY